VSPYSPQGIALQRRYRHPYSKEFCHSKSGSKKVGKTFIRIIVKIFSQRLPLVPLLCTRPLPWECIWEAFSLF
jgi:hypothetical protein